MIASNQPNPGHSSDVRIQLRVNGQVLSVAQLGPDFLVLKDTINHPADEAEITLSIDGEVSRWKIGLPDGIAPGQLRTRIARVALP